jgi:hypothetical protein
MTDLLEIANVLRIRSSRIGGHNTFDGIEHPRQLPSISTAVLPTNFAMRAIIRFRVVDNLESKRSRLSGVRLAQCEPGLRGTVHALLRRS